MCRCTRSRSTWTSSSKNARSAVLYAGAAHHRHRAGLRPHHLGHRRRHDRLVRCAMLCYVTPKEPSRLAQSRRRQGRRDHLQDRAHASDCARPSGGAIARRRRSPARVSISAGGSVQSRASIPTPRANITTRPCRRTAHKVAQFLLDVWAEILLDEITQDVRDYAATLNDPNSMGMTQQGKSSRTAWRRCRRNSADMASRFMSMRTR